MKKLNNKGFTLIELLAVIVILAIVMGVAANAILNVMNDSRKNTLQSSAKSAADAFRTAYAENQLKNNNTILGLSSSTLLKGDSAMALTSAATNLNISTTNYDLAKSYVRYNPSDGSFTVCLTARANGGYYLDTAKSSAEVKKADNKITLASGTMWACSDDSHSWS